MTNLNSKKARQRIATLYNIITVEDREMRSILREDWSDRAFETLYNKSRCEFQGAIIELVEVCGIPHTLYAFVIKDIDRRAEKQAAETNYNYNDYGLDAWDVK